jgi:arginyl-tRNA synthetase
MLKQQLHRLFSDSLTHLKLEFDKSDLLIIDNQNLQNGDYSTNIAMVLAKRSGTSPTELAHKIIDGLEDCQLINKLDVAGPGFINITVEPTYLAAELRNIITTGDNYGSNDSLTGQKIQVEFISANPTGPLTLANGRGGAIGDTLAAVLQFCGADVEREYYVNDTGNQVRTLAESVKAVAGVVPADPKHYQGEYVKELADLFKDQLELPSQDLGHILADYMLEHQIKPAIKRLGINFDRFFSERSLYPDGVKNALSELENRSLAYKDDSGAWLFSGTGMGDDKDRVLVTSMAGRGREEPTYFLADIAHQLQIHSEGFVKRIYVLGADHHSYAQRMNIVFNDPSALDYRAPFANIHGTRWLDEIMMQLVRLIKDGQEFRMSKRAGTYVTLDELLDQVASDAIRYFFLMNAETTHLEFNIDLAREHSQKNPVFYVQYAHARMSNILNKQSLIDNPNLDLLVTEPEQTLIKHLILFPDLVVEIASSYKTHQLTTYGYRLADLFHKFYEHSPVLKAGDPSLLQARLSLVRASQITLANTLRLMGISAPEKM